jgi:hypothetical protein
MSAKISHWYQDGDGVLPGGDVGGDIQVGESWTVRFYNDSLSKAVIDISVYAVDHALKQCPPIHAPDYGVQIQAEFTICRDRKWPGDTEEWADVTYDDRLARYPSMGAADEAAREIAHLYASGARIPANWNGQPWNGYDQRPR